MTVVCLDIEVGEFVDGKFHSSGEDILRVQLDGGILVKGIFRSIDMVQGRAEEESIAVVLSKGGVET